MTTTRAEREREISTLAAEFVSFMEAMREYKIAYDRIGDKKYNQCRREAISKLVQLLRATAIAARMK